MTLLYLLLQLVLVVSSGEEEEDLPKWNTASLFGFDSPSDDTIDSYIDEAMIMAKALYSFRDEVDRWPVEVLEAYDRVQTIVAHPLQYLSIMSMLQPDNEQVAALMSDVQSRTAHISQSLLGFVDAELLKLDWQQEGHKYRQSRPDLYAKWRFFTPYIERLHSLQPHILDSYVEMILAQRDSWVGKESASKYHSQALSHLRVNWTNPVTNETSLMTPTSLTQCQQNSDWRVRASCMKAQNDLLKNDLSVECAASLTQITGDWIIDSAQRNFKIDKNIRAKRYYSNHMSRTSVEAMTKVVREMSPKFAVRFFRLKKRLLKAEDETLPELRWSDRTAEFSLSNDTKGLKWDKGVSLVRDAFSHFDEFLGTDNFTYAALFDQFLQEERYQVAPTALGGGSFCTATSPDVGPLVNLEWTGLIPQVFTIAHETGHAIQFEYSRPMGSIYYDIGLGLSETASLFAEQILGAHLLSLRSGDSRADKLFRLEVQMYRLDAIMNTVVRQGHFDLFEEGMYSIRQQGDILDTESIVEVWTKALSTFYEDAFDNYDNSEYYWCQVSHFYEVPFYVYNYVWAQLIASSIFARKSDESFGAVWRSILTSGSSKSPQELLSPLKIDLEAESFWREAIDSTVNDLLESAEQLARDVGV